MYLNDRQSVSQFNEPREGGVNLCDNCSKKKIYEYSLKSHPDKDQ